MTVLNNFKQNNIAYSALDVKQPLNEESEGFYVTILVKHYHGLAHYEGHYSYL